MKTLKTTLTIILSIIAISTIIYFLPTDGFLNKLPVINRFYNNTTLEIVSINGKAKVNINDTEYGETPLTINDLDQGEYTITLERISDTQNFYNKQTFNIKLTKNTTSRIEIEIGPAGILHGSILYYTPQNNPTKNTGTLSILCDTETSKIYLDTEYLKQTPLTAYELPVKEYNLEIAANNYETLNLPILIENGYMLNVKAYLFPVPVNFDNNNDE
ncbi:PEGA domain-containing protein [bacterium]|nr:PEGA domain-containing protein [bacterium]